MKEETYLGDGLYVRFDGYQFILRAPRDGGDHWVALEPGVLRVFDRYVAETLTKLRETQIDRGHNDPTSYTGSGKG